MSDTNIAGERQRQANGNQSLIEKLIFDQDLDEVHLLIDAVSGRADRSLNALAMPDPADPAKILTSAKVIKAIADMRYPPTGTDAVNARNAAILLLAKDRLSAMAAPASGRTIAYTRLFTNQEAKRRAWLPGLGRLRRTARDRDLHRPDPAPAAAGKVQPPAHYRDPHHDIRADLAQRSFPGLEAHARKFRLWRDGLVFFSLIWLLITALAYWDAGLGRSALERLDQDWKNIAARLNENPALLSCSNGTGAERTAAANPTPGRTTVDPKLASDPRSSVDEIRKEFDCRKYAYLRVMAQTAGQQVNDVFRCENMGWVRLAHAWCWQGLLAGGAAQPEKRDRPPGVIAARGLGGDEADPTPAAAAGQVSPYARANALYWQTATSILSVFATYILPMMFALLGTLIGAFRAILNRIGTNELSPRDLVRMQIGIPTGLVAGIAVGLFLSPSSVPAYGAGGVSAQLTLTASGLGFLAGYASHSFFGFLDNVIRNVFPYGSTPNAAVANAAALPTAAGPATESRA